MCEPWWANLDFIPVKANIPSYLCVQQPDGSFRIVAAVKVQRPQTQVYAILVAVAGIDARIRQPFLNTAAQSLKRKGRLGITGGVGRFLLPLYPSFYQRNREPL